MKFIINLKNSISYEIELINQTIFKKIIRRTYKITKIIYKFGMVQRIRKLIIIVIFAFGLQFSNLKPVKTVVQTPTEIQRQLQDAKSTQADRAMKGSKSSSIRNLLKISAGDLGKLSNPGARAQNAARNSRNNRVKGPKNGKSKSGGRFFVKAWSQKNSNRSRPTAANRFSQQSQAGQDGGENGLFGRFSPRSAPNPLNPGCSSGPKSVTVLSGQKNPSSSVKQNTKIIEAHDGFKAELTDKSVSHLTSKHGHKFGVDDPLPLPPNQKPTKYEQIRTRLNKENKAKVGKEIESILSNPESDVYLDVSIRGIQGRVYHCRDTDRVVGIHTEGEFKGQIMKGQPISDPQLDLLRELNILD